MNFQMFTYLGFLLAAYAIVANDSIQTIGTFISSNRHLSWKKLWVFISSIFAGALVYGWVCYQGDVSYGRLNQIGHPGEIEWWHIVPPAFMILLTRKGIPVSTTFLVLSVFSSEEVLGAIIQKSLLGYGISFLFSFAVWSVLANTIEGRLSVKEVCPDWNLEKPSKFEEPPSRIWIALQWASTGLLWQQWLIQDFSNIFVYLPRQLHFAEMIGCLAVMLGILAFVLRSGGGAIHGIVGEKTNLNEVRSASLINLAYAGILFVFKEYSDLPMSTTWVFIGILAGREFALHHYLPGGRPWSDTAKIAGLDFGKASFGLAVSLVVALGARGLGQAGQRVTGIRKEAAIVPAKVNDIQIETQLELPQVNYRSCEHAEISIYDG